jgi:hypothetical protein
MPVQYLGGVESRQALRKVQTVEITSAGATTTERHREMPGHLANQKAFIHLFSLLLE